MNYKNIIISIIFVIVIISLVWLGLKFWRSRSSGLAVPTDTPSEQIATGTGSMSVPVAVEEVDGTAVAAATLWTEPLPDTTDRVSLKPFGIHITPATSPVQPERFSGYHTGIDLETGLEEKEATVEVRSVCAGKALYRNYVSGYGGVLVVACELDMEPVTVLYGHLALSSITVAEGDPVGSGQVIGRLGRGYSPETDGERKHLHLAIHRGSAIELRGYVSRPELLAEWIDPCLYVCATS